MLSYFLHLSLLGFHSTERTSDWTKTSPRSMLLALDSHWLCSSTAMKRCSEVYSIAFVYHSRAQIERERERGRGSTNWNRALYFSRRRVECHGSMSGVLIGGQWKRIENSNGLLNRRWRWKKIRCRQFHRHGFLRFFDLTRVEFLSQ